VSKLPFPFDPVPAALLRALRNRLVSRDEFCALAYLYARATNRSARTWVVTITLAQLGEAIAWEHSAEWLRQMLVRLRSKGWIAYESRSGQRKPYDIRLLWELEVSWRLQPSADAASSDPDDTPSWRLPSSSLRSEESAKPLGEPLPAPLPTGAVGGPSYVSDKDKPLGEENYTNVEGEGTTREAAA
jgi:hypothetical protein